MIMWLGMLLVIGLVVVDILLIKMISAIFKRK